MKFSLLFSLLTVAINWKVTQTQSASLCSNILVKYNAKKNPTAPRSNGIFLGKFFDGSDVYVGVINQTSKATSVGCPYEHSYPARITTNGTNPGGYTECVIDDFSNTDVYYLKDDPNFIWVPADIGNTASVPNLIRYTTPTGLEYAYGRIRVTASNGQRYITVGKVHLNVFQGGIWYWTEFGTGHSDFGYEVLACRKEPIPPPPPLCSNTLVKYNAITNPTAPRSNGIYIGNFFDGSDVYVGVINQTDGIPCFYEHSYPARITTNGTNPGGYTECVIDDFSNTDVYYLKDDPNFIWVPADIGNTASVPNLIRYTTPTGFDYAYGRIRVTASNGQRYITVGKVHLTILDAGIWYWTEFGTGRSEFGYEVLACRKEPIPPPPPLCSITLVKYNALTNPTAPRSNGIYIGNFFDGSDVYVGVINQTDGIPCFYEHSYPARITTNGTNPGGYTECVIDDFSNTNVYYLKNDPNFIWVETNSTAVTSVPNLIRYTTPTGFDYAFGRIRLTASNGKSYITVGKVHLTIFDDARIWYWTEFGTGYSFTGYEVLACRNESGVYCNNSYSEFNGEYYDDEN
ncbi:hypothetical protein PVAND_015372 [Polypedilum vanderplanki]|uniref:Uncharacterized protein n=1 Tax=Polypedilum vanderplanki TaxID=319348 RepID=A0A9J6BCL9_POLVA|nr:hypothetical protein PVAND_015372 [Polypedilum vanderplanki]